MSTLLQSLLGVGATGQVPARASTRSAMAAGAGGAIAIFVVATLSASSSVALMMAPLGATCFLAFGVPESPLAQPRNIIFGHIIAATVGLIVLNLVGSGPLALSLGVGIAIAAMQLLRAGHPPAGANPLVIIGAGADWDFLLFPVASGALLIVFVALIVNGIRRDVRYPLYW